MARNLEPTDRKKGMSTPSKVCDEKVRSTLAGRGDDGRTPRHTSFFFYGDNVDALGAAAIRAGYLVRPAAARDGIVLETMIAVDERSFELHARRMESWAEEFDCEYDGWECRIVNQ